MTKLEIIEAVKSTKFTSDDGVYIKVYDKDNNVIYNESFWGCQVSGNLMAKILEDDKNYNIEFGCWMNYGCYRTPCRVEITEQ